MRIAIVNDVTIAIEALRRVILSVSGHQVAWVARDGAEAVERCSQDTPDLILMDLMMPVMDGVEATRRIMAHTPCAILIVTATFENHFSKIFEALGAGALDVVQTPVLDGGSALPGAAMLKVKIESIGRRISADDRHKLPAGTALEQSYLSTGSSDCLITIGASAGGPAILAAILSSLPHDFRAAIVIVQHMDAQFVPLMAGWLNQRCALPVQIAQQRDRPQLSTVLIAGTSDHLVFTNSRSLGYTSDPLDCCYRPSIDVFFHSAARNWKGKLAGVLLSGMGRDGASGLKAIREAGHSTIAQDAGSCVVYGMPKAAVELGAAAKVLPASQIAGELMNFATP